MSLQAGQIVADKYRIVRMLGQGGMGEVYEGENVRIHRRVAIKTLLSGVSSRGDVVQRFEREAQAAGRIGSEHIVEVLDLGDLPDGSRYMVMEFLEGTTLSDRIVKSGRVAAREAARIVIELCEGLQAAHQAGIVHRDLKPANVFLIASKGGRQDVVKILDFGVSKFSVLGDEMSMTRTGAVVGTPYYMSPEQAKGAKSIDARSDLYSVGVILYESVTGQIPFNAQTFNELIFKIALESPPPPESFVPDLDPHFASIVRKAMAREPNDRFQTALELRQALEAWAMGYDRAAMGGGVPAAPGAYLGGPGGFARGGATQILGPGDFAPPANGPTRDAAFASQQQQQQQLVYPAAPIPTASSGAGAGKSAGVVFVLVALLVVLVGGGGAAAVVMLRRSPKPAASIDATTTSSGLDPTPPPATTSAAPATTTTAGATTPAASATAEPSSSGTSIASLPNASATPASLPTGSRPPPAPTGGHTAGAPATRPTAEPPTPPTAKPTSGRPITGDL